MTLARARAEYAAVAESLAYHGDICRWAGFPCRACHILGGLADALSIAVDLAVAEASLERIRGGVAW